MGKLNVRFLAGVVLGLALHSSAQSVAVSGFTGEATPIQAIGDVPAQPDSIVAVAAESQGLLPIAREDLPRGGTYWWVQPGGQAVPTPFPSTDMSQAIYQITDGQFLVDQTGGAVVVQRRQLGSRTATDSIATAAMAQADAVVNLISQVQDAEDNRQMRSMMRSMGMDDEEDSGGSDSPMFAMIDTNSLYLEITNVSNGWSYLNLHNATNQVYAIESTTNLLTSWHVETELWPSGDQTNVMPFSIQNFGRQDLFFRAQDWTGVMTNGLFCWWTWLYFGNLNESVTDLDLQGINTLGYDYTNSLDPNVISFTVSATNNYFNQSTVPLQLNVLAGVPSYYAVLVNDDNQSDADWQKFTGTNLAVSLGSTDGVYTVSVGLRGLPEIAQQTWETVQVTHDTIAPTLVITNPTANITAQPMIQLQGYSTKPLSAISYGISNSLGVVNNQPGYVKMQYFDEALFAFTTNWIQCYDIGLTNGLNIITVLATDKAGNTTTTNISITLDYSTATNPPNMQIVWPPDGGQICADSFTCRGTLDDPTATVTASITDTNDVTSVVNGLVERNGNFWVENLPLSGGANILTLAVTNAAGLGTVTSLTLTQDTQATLTMDPVSPDQLWQPTVSVTGVASDTNCTIEINGVEGVNNSDGTWYADDVPVSDGGTACFDLTATPSSSQSYQFRAALNSSSQTSSPNSSINNTNIDKPAQIFVSCYYLDWTKTFTAATRRMNSISVQPSVVAQPPNEHYHLFWQDDISVTAYDILSGTFGTCTENYAWPADEYILGVSSPSHGGTMTSTCSTNVYEVAPPTVLLEHCKIETNNTTSSGTTKYTRTAQTVLFLKTGGKAISRQNNLFQISGTATAITNLATGAGYTVPPTQIEMGILGTLGVDSNLWCVLQDNDTKDITPSVTTTLNPDYYTFTAAQDKFTPKIDWLGHGEVTDKTSTVIVGEQIGLYGILSSASGNTAPAITNYLWNVSGYAVTNFYVSTDFFQTNGHPILLTVKTNREMDFFWADKGKKPVQYTIGVMGQNLTAQTTFNVLRPTSRVYTKTSSLELGASMGSSRFAMAFGTNGGNSGIVFSNVLTLPIGNYNYGITNYQTEWVQLITSTPSSITENGTNHTIYTTGTVLDTTYPYNNVSGTAISDNSPTTEDSPSITLAISGETAASNAQVSKMWLMFKPQNGDWVPLTTVDWNISSSASLSGTNWVLINPSWSTNPPDADAGTTYPVWTDNVANTNSFNWNPPL